jgi:hypothetical protein
MQNSNFVDEDWERLPLLDQMYLDERERELWEEYQEYMDSKNRLPAKIIVNEQIIQKASDIQNEELEVREVLQQQSSQEI